MFTGNGTENSFFNFSILVLIIIYFNCNMYKKLKSDVFITKFLAQ